MSVNLKAAEAVISQLRDQLSEAHKTIDRLESQLTQAYRILDEGNAVKTLDDFCPDCSSEWDGCECDDEGLF